MSDSRTGSGSHDENNEQAQGESLAPKAPAYESSGSESFDAAEDSVEDSAGPKGAIPNRPDVAQGSADNSSGEEGLPTDAESTGTMSFSNEDKADSRSQDATSNEVAAENDIGDCVPLEGTAESQTEGDVQEVRVHDSVPRDDSQGEQQATPAAHSPIGTTSEGEGIKHGKSEAAEADELAEVGEASELEPSAEDDANPYAAYGTLDPYADDADDVDDGSDVTDDEAHSYRTASEYSRVNAARHYTSERKSVLLPVAVALFAGVVVLAGVIAFLFGTRPATQVALDGLGLTSSQKEDDEQASSDDQTAAEASPVDINITMAGDVLVQYSVLTGTQNSAGEYDFTNVFSSVKSDLSDADLALIDQESSMAGESYGYASSMPYNAPNSLGEAEKDAGIDVVLKASNYALDLGYDGLHDELQNWSENEPSMEVLGVADPEGSVGTDRVSNVYLYEKDGFKVAILNYTYGTDAVVSSSTDSSYVATLSEDKVKADVAAAREAGADMIVACPHWGVEYSTSLSNEQTTYGQLFADEGVDVVLGDHPHVVQPVRVLTGSDGHTCVCFYSLGNFVSGTRNTSSLVGSLAKVTLHKDSDGTCSVTAASLVPVVTHRANGTAFGVYRLSAYTDQLARQGWDTYLTPSYVQNLLDTTLGLTYDESTGEYAVDLSAAATDAN